jgi:Ca-activated chloride channel family protein
MIFVISNGLYGTSYIEDIGELQSGSLVFKTKGKKGVYSTSLKTKVQINITGAIARVKVIQKFHNPTNDWREGVYVFPLPDDAAVDHMHMKIGQRIVVGKIQEKSQAKKTYEKAKNEGKSTSLVVQQRPNIFTTNVANIAPHSDIEITIEYQQSVLHRDEKFSLRFPMVVGPRYIPSVKSVPDAKEITPEIQNPKDGLINPIDIEVNMALGYRASQIHATHHQVDVNEVSENRYQVTFNKKEYANKDFILTWKAKNGMTPQAAFFTEKKDNSIYGLLMVNPPQKEFIKKLHRPREVIFVIDSSGSMSGTSMPQAKNAVSMALKKLKPTDKFNIIDFDNEFFPMAKHAIKVTDENILDAQNFVRRLDADGGTEAYPALKYAFDSQEDTPSSKEYLRQIIFITDGDIGNENQMFNLIKSRLGNNRLFTVGIGSAPNSHFMKKASEYGRGSFVFIGNLKEVQEKMNILYKKISVPALTDIKIHIPDWIDASFAPKVIPDLYEGEQIVVAMKLNKLPKTDVLISGKVGKDDWSTKMTLTQLDDTSGVSVLWARKKIDDFMAMLRHSNLSETNKKSIKESIVELGLMHHLVTKYTSLVAVDETPRRIKMALKKDRLKVNLPEGMNPTFVNAPSTATNSMAYLIFGLILLSLSTWLLWVRKIEE